MNLDKDDLTLQALAILQSQHPEVKTRMLQSRGIVVSLLKRQDGPIPSRGGKVSPLAWELLEAGSYLPSEQDPRLEEFLASHERFLTTQGFDPEKQVKTAQEAQMAKERIELVDATSEALQAPTERWPPFARGDWREEEKKSVLIGWFDEYRGAEAHIAREQRNELIIRQDATVYRAVKLTDVELLELGDVGKENILMNASASPPTWTPRALDDGLTELKQGTPVRVKLVSRAQEPI